MYKYTFIHTFSMNMAINCGSGLLILNSQPFLASLTPSNSLTGPFHIPITFQFLVMDSLPPWIVAGNLLVGYSVTWYNVCVIV
jgi:hypothetical protein